LKDFGKLGRIKKECLEAVLRLHRKANAGHIGSSLSCLDILIYLHFARMGKSDRFVLSKGHGASALYAVLSKTGRIPERCLDTFYQDGTVLAAHPPCCGNEYGILFGTGSLGHGLSLATGIALARKYKRKKFSVYCVLSDGDCNEGSTWEAALFAAHHKLTNLYAIIDNNGIQAFGRTKDVLDLEPLSEKWKAFNFDVVVAENGNSLESLDRAFSELDRKSRTGPSCVIAKTTKGSGISFMEDSIAWHYRPMSEEEFELALEEVEEIDA
jgi:transketolase